MFSITLTQPQWNKTGWTDGNSLCRPLPAPATGSLGLERWIQCEELVNSRWWIVRVRLLRGFAGSPAECDLKARVVEGGWAVFLHHNCVADLSHTTQSYCLGVWRGRRASSMGPCSWFLKLGQSSQCRSGDILLTNIPQCLIAIWLAAISKVSTLSYGWLLCCITPRNRLEPDAGRHGK